MRLIIRLTSLLALIMVSGALRADNISYANVGGEATSSLFSAANTGSITAYFYGASSAYTSVIGMSVNGAPVELWGLKNHASTYGDGLVLGNVNAGDTITFKLFVINTGLEWSSDLTSNSDHFNHSFAANFGGSSLIPAGTYIGFEDLAGGGDRDYNDVQFVFTNTGFSKAYFASAAAEPVPEPVTLSLLGLGVTAILGLRRKWKK